VVKMEWVEGLLVNQVVRDNTGKPAVLAALGQMWVRLCKRLRDAGVAHADVQHGNVLLVPGARAGAFGLKLIDYDGMWVPALANTPSGESGHPSYQHPQRAAGRAYSPDLDRFPHLVVATALRGLAVGGAALWDKYDNGDNLLFEEADFKNPAGSAVMADLWRTDDPATQALVGRLAVACGRPIPQTPWLDQIVTEAGDPRPLDDAARRDAAAALGVSLPVVVTAAPPPAAPAVNPFALDEAEVLPPRPAKPQPAAAPNRTTLYVAAAALLLVGAGAVGLAVVLGGKPAEVAQKEEPPPPREGPKTKEKEKAKEKLSSQPKPPEPTPPVSAPPPAPPDVPPMPAIPAAPAARFATHEVWTVEQPPSASGSMPTLTRDGTAVASNNGGKMSLFDAATGKRLADAPDQLFDNRIVGMADGKFGRARLGDPVPVWDARAGKIDRHLSVGRLPFPGSVFLSPTGRYIAAAPGSRNAEQRLVLEAHNPVKTVLDVEWKRGEVFYPDDESRALMSEATGKCRWFELPSGKAGGEWNVPAGGGEVQALSGNGAVAALWVPDGERPPGVVALDTRTGKVLHHVFQPRKVEPSLSRDGRYLLVPTTGGGRGEGATVFDLTAKAAVADVAPPAGYTWLLPVILPDGSGCVAIARAPDRRAVVRYDFRPDGVVAVKPPDPAPPVPAPAGAPAKLVQRFQADTGRAIVGNPLIDPSGKAIVVAVQGPPSMTAFDARTGKELARLDTLTGNPWQFFALDGARFGYQNQTDPHVVVWDPLAKLTANRPYPRFPAGAPDLAVSPDGRYFATCPRPQNAEVGAPAPLTVTDTQTPRPVVNTVVPAGRAYFTADSARALVADDTGRFRWYALPGGRADGDGWGFDLAPNGFNSRGVAVSPGGRWVLFEADLPGRGRTHHLLDGKTGAVVHSFPAKRYNGRGAVADDGRVAFVRNDGLGTGNSVEVLDAKGVVLATAPIPRGKGAVVALSWPARAVVMYERDTGRLTVYDLPDAAVAPPVPPPAPPAAGLRWRAPTDKLFVRLHVSEGAGVVYATAAGPGGLGAFDLKTGAPRADLADFARPATHYLAPFGPGRVGAWRFASRTVRVWDEKAGSELGAVEIPDVPPPAAGKGHYPYTALSPDGKVAASGFDRGGPELDQNLPLVLYDLTANRAVRELTWSGGHVHFTADGGRALVAETAGRGRWYKLPGGEPDGEFDLGRPASWKHEVLGMSADGAVLAYYGPRGGGGMRPLTVDGKTGAVIRVFPPASNSNTRVCVSADGRRAAWTAGEKDGFVAYAADARTGAPLGRFPVGGTFAFPALSADGSVLIVATYPNGGIHAFDVRGPKP